MPRRGPSRGPRAPRASRTSRAGSPHPLTPFGMSRDYYEVLGVARDAAPEEIKKAFRKRARELHPDVNPGDPEAEARFKETAEAYEVLSNPETRAVYDRYGHEGVRGRGGGTDFADFGSFQDLFDAFFGGDAFGRRSGPQRGEDIAVSVTISFVESARGVAREVEVDRDAVCDVCEGSGAAPGSGLERCETCAGQGQVRQVVRGPLGQFLRTQACPTCAGRGEVPAQRCPNCLARGRVRAHATVSLEIPAGISGGQRIRMSGQGHAGEAGAPAGDLYVLVQVSADERLHRDGLDVVVHAGVPVTEAMVGGEITVPTVDGEARVEVRPGTQPGDEVVLRGKGFPALEGRRRGDQRVVLDVKVPKVTSDEGKQAVQALGETLDERSYQHESGFFERLRHAFR